MQIKVLHLLTLLSKFFLIFAFIWLQSSFVVKMGKKYYEHIYHSPPYGIMKIRLASYYFILASRSTLMTDSKYLGTIQIWQNLNEHHYYLTSTTSVISQIDANCSPFNLLNMLPIHIRLERLKLTYDSLITNFPKYHFLILKCIHDFRIS